MRKKHPLTKPYLILPFTGLFVLNASLYGCGGSSDSLTGLRVNDNQSAMQTGGTTPTAEVNKSDSSHSATSAETNVVARATTWLPSMPSEVKHNAKKYKVMTIGDSITFGVGTTTPSGGYREALRRVSQPVLSFVGSQTNGYSTVAHNEGYPGAAIATLDSIVVPKLQTYSPDIVMILAGINNLGKRNSGYTGVKQGLKDMTTFLADIKKKLPKAKVLVSTLTPLAPSSNYASSTDIKTFNTGLKSVISTAGATFVDNFTNAGIGTTDISSDGIHPNDSGYAKLGKIWAKSVNSL